MPVIVAGLRTATVWVIGTATLSTPVGATSLGNFIFSGLQTRNFDAVLVGCIAAAALALTLDQLIRGLESGIRERRRARVRLAGGALAALLLFTGASFFADRGTGDRRPVTIGSKAFTEQYVLSEVLAQQIATLDQIVEANPLSVVSRRPGGKRLCRCRPFSRHSRLRYRSFFYWPHWFSRLSVKDVGERLLANLDYCLDRSTVYGDISQNWPCSEVVIPHTVVNGLEVPHSFSGFGVNAD